MSNVKSGEDGGGRCRHDAGVGRSMDRQAEKQMSPYIHAGMEAKVKDGGGDGDPGGDLENIRGDMKQARSRHGGGGGEGGGGRRSRHGGGGRWRW